MTLKGIWELKKIAMRNLMRHKVKTFLTAAAIMVSVAVFIFLNCWLGGTQIESRRNIVQFEIGAAKLQTLLYFERKDEMPSYETFENWEMFQRALASQGFNAAPRYVFSGMLMSTSGMIPVIFHGIDPELEAQTLRWPEFIEFGRYVENGSFEINLGRLAADRLNVGIPIRPRRSQLEELIVQVAANQSEADFIRSLYEPGGRRGFWDLVPEETHEGNERLFLRSDIQQLDIDRFWEMVMASGRNDLRISATIDIRAVPETIRADRFRVEVMENLRAEDRQLVQDAYEYLEEMDIYVLRWEIEDDERHMNLILDAMIRAGFAGAVRNVFQVIDVTVVGIINSPAPFPNGNTAFIPLDVLQDEAGMMLEGVVTELVINYAGRTLYQLPGANESSAAITAALERGLGFSLPEHLGIFTWEDYMADYIGYEEIQLGMPNVVVFLLLILSLLGISNTILMAVMERTKETGMMRAMGMSDGQMKLTYMLEAGFIGLIGSVLGILLGIAINYPMVEYGMDFSAMADTMSGDGSIGFRVTGEFRSMWRWDIIFGSGIAATIISFLIAYFPTKKALKMSITDSLRFE